jgi:hypothetical protein
MQNVYDVNPFLKEEIDKIASELNYQFDKKISYSNRYLSLRANIMRKINKSTEDYFGKSLNEFNEGDIVGSVHRNSDITKYKILDITPFEVKIISLSHAFPKAEYQRTKELGEHWELIEPKKSLQEVFKILKEKTPLMPENKNKEIGQNPIKFNIGDIIESIYNKQKYKVIDPDKKGIAKLLNLESNVVQDFNSTSNPHFKLVKKSSGFPTMQYVESPATQDIRVLNKIVAEYIYAKTDEEKLFKKTLIKDQIDTLKKYLSKKEIQDVKKWEGAINGAISSAMSVLNSNVLKPKTETMFKQNIATKPEKLSFDYLLSSNSGDRKSPTQSAGQLRSLYANKPKYEKELFSTLFKGNDNNWYKLGKDKNNTWRWEKADEQSKEESPAKKVFSNEAFDIDKKISIVKEKGKPLSQFKNGEKVFWANVTQDGNFKSYVEGTVFNKGNEYGIKRFPQNPEAKKYPVANFNSTTRVVLKPENDPIYTGTTSFPKSDKKQKENIEIPPNWNKEAYLKIQMQKKSPAKDLIDHYHSYNLFYENRKDNKLPVEDIVDKILKAKAELLHFLTKDEFKKNKVWSDDINNILKKHENQVSKIEKKLSDKQIVSKVSKETKIDNYLKKLLEEPISMRDFAKSLIAVDVIRGYDISSIKSGSAGRVNDTGWVSVGGYVNGKNITSNKILVEKFKGKTVQEIFSLQELYNEIKKETSDLPETTVKKEKPTNTKKNIEDALTGAKAYLKYAKDTEKSDIKAYIRGLEILLK